MCLYFDTYNLLYPLKWHETSQPISATVPITHTNDKPKAKIV